MLEASQSSKSILGYVADYAELATSEEEIAACKALLDSIIIPVRTAPNNPLEAVEPVTAFHVGVERSEEPHSLESGAEGEAGSSSSGELIYLTVSEVASLYRAKKLSPVELTQAVIGRIEQLNPQLQAYVTLVTEQALEAAKQAEAEITAGKIRGPLHGIPLALKDLIETKGIATTASSKVLADYVPEQQAAVAEKLEAAGAILLGKTHTHEFAYGVICPPTRNPWNPDHIPGGSSGGSATAVASGMATLAIGTDTGGSIRIPSALCGTVGLKPTYGRVSRRGVISLSWSFDHVGPIARSTEDAALMLQAIAGYDSGDPASANVEVGDYTASLKTGIKGLRVGVLRGSYFELITPQVGQAVRQAAEVLRDLGAELHEVDLNTIGEAVPLAFTAIAAEASSYHQKWLREKAELYGPDVRVLLKAGELILATDYLQAQRRRGIFNEEVSQLFKQVDVLLLPTEPCVAPGIGQDAVDFGVVQIPTLTALIYYTAPFNVCGLPALSLPCGFSDGLPIGLQIVGRPFDEAGVLRVGYAYEQATDWHKQHPK
jgi:aspartyl-tRNA(Asn)/glutamyl-tRNA(Gln) amidotransferase subunit A